MVRQQVPAETPGILMNFLTSALSPRSPCPWGWMSPRRGQQRAVPGGADALPLPALLLRASCALPAPCPRSARSLPALCLRSAAFLSLSSFKTAPAALAAGSLICRTTPWLPALPQPQQGARGGPAPRGRSCPGGDPGSPPRASRGWERR